MKKLVLAATVALFSLGISTLASAASCAGDVGEMKAQIYKYDSITAKDGRIFHDVRGPQESLQCFASGYEWSGNRLEYVCMIAWEKGNWGQTFRCK